MAGVMFPDCENDHHVPIWEYRRTWRTLWIRKEYYVCIFCFKVLPKDWQH